jgi:hypothetical protein
MLLKCFLRFHVQNKECEREVYTDTKQGVPPDRHPWTTVRAGVERWNAACHVCDKCHRQILLGRFSAREFLLTAPDV